MEMDTKTTPQRDALYLESSEDPSQVTLLSMIAIFLQQYCKYHNLDIILVCESDPAPSAKTPCDIGNSNVSFGVQLKKTDEDLNNDSSCSAEIGMKLLGISKNLEYTVLKRVCLPQVVKDCQLPCILLEGRQLCISGLANVLRYIIQAAAPLEPHRKLETLLGFRQTCLRCCSESSIWTKLSEVDTPRQVTNFLKGHSGTSTCPPCLTKFNELLSEPVATFNSEKLRRKLLKNSKNTGTGSQDGGGSNEEKKARSHQRDVAGKREVKSGKDDGAECSKKEVSEEDWATLGEERFGDDAELSSEFSTKMNLVNKKEKRREKREQNQAAATNSNHTISGNVVTQISKEQLSIKVADGSDDRGSKNENGEMASHPEEGSQKSGKKPKNKKKVHKDSLPKLTHLFAQGIDVTLADFALFIPIHLWVHTSSLNGMTHNAYMTVPLVLEWYQRMWDVPSVRQVASTCLGLREVDITQYKEALCDEDDTVKESSKTESQISEEDVRPHVGNLSLGRKAIRDLLKKVLPSVMVNLEDQGLNGRFMAHPSKDTALDWRNMHAAVSPIEGEVEARRAQGKEQQIESIVTAVQEIAIPGTRILDFCSGGGHLGIALAYCLPDSHVIMIENKDESLRRALGRVLTLGLQNVSLYQSNIDYFYGHFDIGVSLHACGVATDMVLSKCVEQKASFVSSPCCYGSLHDTHHMTYPRSQVFKKSSISKKDYFLVGHGAEQTCWDFESHHAKQGKQCMGYIDRDRAELAREHGYDVTVCSLKPETCSPKNNLLIGVSPARQGIKARQS